MANDTAAMQAQWVTSIDTFNATSAVFSEFLNNATEYSLLSQVSTVYFDLNVTDEVFGTDFYSDVTEANVNSKQGTAIGSFYRAMENFTAVEDMFRARYIVFQLVTSNYASGQKVSFMFNVVSLSTTIVASETLVSCWFRFSAKLMNNLSH